MVDLTKAINYNRTQEEMEEWVLISMAVAGKTGWIQARALDKFLNNVSWGTPFQKILYMKKKGIFEKALKESKLGQYKKLSRGFTQVARRSIRQDINLKNCTVKDFEDIHGIGPKTARMLILHSRKKQRVAALDTHLLKYLRELGHNVPKITPSKGKKYDEIEELFLKHCDDTSRDYSELDLEIWNKYAKKDKG